MELTWKTQNGTTVVLDPDHPGLPEALADLTVMERAVLQAYLTEASRAVVRAESQVRTGGQS